MSVFKREQCKCGYRRETSTPSKSAGQCPKCGAGLTYSDNWYISYTVGGKRYLQSVGTQKRMAEDALSKKRVEIREGRFFDKAADTTWESEVKIFRRWFGNNTRPNTQSMYENSLKNLSKSKYFKGKQLSKITPATFEQYKTERLEIVGNASVNREIATAKRLYSLALEAGRIEVNRIQKVKLLPETPRARYLSDDELRTLIDNCGPEWLKLKVYLAANTGLRSHTLSVLQWTEIDFASRFIATSETKGGKYLKAPLTQDIVDRLRAWKASQKILSRWVLPSPLDPAKHIGETSHTFDKACDNAGLKDFRFHDLRHTFASNFYRRTKDWKALQIILGHADISITMRVYTHLNDTDLTAAMAIYEKGGR